MSAYTDTALSPALVNQFIRKIVVMCDEHGAKWGTPQSLPGFIRALDKDKHLAMDFWSLVASMSEGDSGVGPEPNRVVEVIVEGVTGRSVAEVIVTGGVERRAVSDLTRLLAGEDIWGPATGSLKSSKRIEVIEDSKVQKAPASKDVRRGDDLLSNKLSNDKDIQLRKDVKGDEELASEREAVQPPAPLASPTSHVSMSASPWQYYESSAAGMREDRRRLFLEPEPLLAQEPPIRVPLGEYEEMGKSRRAIFITLLLLLIVGGTMGGVSLVRRGYGLAYWQRFEAMIHRARSGDEGRDKVPSSVDNSVSSVANSSSPITGGNESEGSLSDEANGVNSDSGAVAPAPEARAAARVGEATKDGVNRPAYQQAYQEGKQAGSATRQRSETVTTTGARGSSLSREEAGTTGSLVQVPAEVMQSRLVSSRVPVYPEAARADHVEGRVVMQAIVTKDGTVGHLHVASGNASLRAAAMEAVSAWRYRPYLVNGEPVDVLTTVSVDFLVK